MVNRLSGQRNPEDTIALRTRSLASRIVDSGMPTMATVGKPGLRWMSTKTGTAFNPMRERVATWEGDMRHPCHARDFLSPVIPKFG